MWNYRLDRAVWLGWLATAVSWGQAQDVSLLRTNATVAGPEMRSSTLGMAGPIVTTGPRSARPLASVSLESSSTLPSRSRTLGTSPTLARFRPMPAAHHASEIQRPKVMMSERQLRAFVTPTSPVVSLRRSFSLLHSSNRRSTVETCSCPAHPLGGIDREAKVVAEIRQTTHPCVIVDAGGYLRMPPNSFNKAGAALALEALAKMSVDAVNVGLPDLAGGLEYLTDLATSASIPFVSANIVGGNGKPVFQPYRTKELVLADGSHVRVALVGVTRPPVQGARELVLPSTVSFADPAATLQSLLAEVRKKADIVILLAYCTREQAPSLVAQLPPRSVDIVVCGEFTVGKNREYYLANSQLIDGVWYLTGGFEGRQLGRALIEVAPTGGIGALAAKLIEIEQTIPPHPAFTHFVTAYQKSKASIPAAH